MLEFQAALPRPFAGLGQRSDGQDFVGTQGFDVFDRSSLWRRSRGRLEGRDFPRMAIRGLFGEREGATSSVLTAVTQIDSPSALKTSGTATWGWPRGAGDDLISGGE
jgi:hypothetical protein